MTIQINKKTKNYQVNQGFANILLELFLGL